jgi:hypothetical protein
VGVMIARGRVDLPFHPNSIQAWPDLALFKLLARRDLRRDALFGWITPFDAARSRALNASDNTLFVFSSDGVSEIAERAAPTLDRLRVRVALLRSVLRCWVRMLFALGMLGSSKGG